MRSNPARGSLRRGRSNDRAVARLHRRMRREDGEASRNLPERHPPRGPRQMEDDHSPADEVTDRLIIPEVRRLEPISTALELASECRREGRLEMEVHIRDAPPTLAPRIEVGQMYRRG